MVGLLGLDLSCGPQLRGCSEWVAWYRVCAVNSTAQTVNMGSKSAKCAHLPMSRGTGCHADPNREIYLPESSATMVVPRAAGLSETRMPAAFIASILLSAPPLPPEMMAPA